MPRFLDKKTFELLHDVPPNTFSLVREALALRQRVVTARQSLKFLQRCKVNDVMPKFIMKKKIGTTCNLPENHPKIINIYRSILGVVIKEKQRVLYSSLLKCASKEQACRRLLPEQTWRRIEGGSRIICDSIRSSIRTTLCEKYDRLLSTKCGKRHNAKLTSSTEHHRPTNIVTNNVATYHPARVTVLGDTRLSDNAVDFLKFKIFRHWEDLEEVAILHGAGKDLAEGGTRT
ncbi:hypothetical protein Y032_0062g3356 [Ancylostoma ceylanicum]|uniref:Uncharacterized protein n=1 Tax=Ancylostoma ceylanicum TaxID=53326 RepID=A0A016U2M5_9BILA|nr:hypothetical protein Y032_0062g3356 [Ancylostoma ceylanicum]